MLVVSDADVIIHLLKLEKLPLLQILFNEVFIPAYVEQEVRFKENSAFALAASYIKTQATSQDAAEQIAASHGIHAGEAHVKTLGEEMNANIMLTNERKVRIAAREEGFQAVGTIGVILRAVHVKSLNKAEAQSLLNKMRDTSFRIYPDILQKAQDALKML